MIVSPKLVVLTFLGTGGVDKLNFNHLQVWTGYDAADKSTILYVPMKVKEK